MKSISWPTVGWERHLLDKFIRGKHSVAVTSSKNEFSNAILAEVSWKIAK